jgi:hypothetical protein
MKNKRGQGLSTETIILIILAIAVLVVLIVGFSMGWSKIAPWISSNNVDNIKTACNAACTSNSGYDYCLAGKDLTSDNEKLKGVTCNYLADKKPIYGIAKCPSVTCTNLVLVELVAGEVIDDKCSGNEGKTIQTLVDNQLVTKECPAQ